GAIRNIAVATRTETSTDDHSSSIGFVIVPNVLEQMNGFTVYICKRVGRIAEAYPPVRVGSPRRTFENQADTEPLCDFGIGAEILIQSRFAFRRPQQMECGEVRQLQSFVED